MPLNEQHPANAAVIHALSQRHANAVAYTARADATDAYYGMGSHPDIVERVWDVLGAAVPRSEACVVYGTPALIGGESGVVIAFCMGMQYVVRVPPDAFAEALDHGYKRTHEWGVKGSGNITDLAEYGTDWVFGLWRADEIEWCSALAAKYGMAQSR